MSALSPEVRDDEMYFTGVATAIEAAGFGVEFDFDAYDEPPGGVITLPDVTGYGLALIWNEGDGWTIGYPRYPGQLSVSCLRTLDHLGEYPVPSQLVAVVRRVADAGSTDGEGRIR